MALDTRALSRHRGTVCAPGLSLDTRRPWNSSLSLSLSAPRAIYIRGQRPGPHQTNVTTPNDLLIVSSPSLSLHTRKGKISLNTRTMSLPQSNAPFGTLFLSVRQEGNATLGESNIHISCYLHVANVRGSCFNTRAGDRWCRCNVGTERRSSRREKW